MVLWKKKTNAGFVPPAEQYALCTGIFAYFAKRPLMLNLARIFRVNGVECHEKVVNKTA